jgi:hypothetical protein
MSFIERQISLTFKFGLGPNGIGAEEDLTITGLRISCEIEIVGATAMPVARLMIWGLSNSVIYKLSTAGQYWQKNRKNSVIIAAGDAGKPLPKIFEGEITQAWADLHDAPNVSFNIQANTGYLAQMAPTAATSYPGQTDAATMIKNLVDRYNKETKSSIVFKNNGVNVQYPKYNTYGTIRDQIKQVIDDSGIEWNNMDNGILEIWPRGSGLGGDAVLLSPQTGMVSYPTFTAQGMTITTLFNPGLRFGGLVDVESLLTPSENNKGLQPVKVKNWPIKIIEHELEAQIPGGAWFTRVHVWNPSVLGGQ